MGMLACMTQNECTVEQHFKKFVNFSFIKNLRGLSHFFLLFVFIYLYIYLTFS